MSRAWAPTHATLFFAVPQRLENPLLMGSLGGGINFEKGVVTEVSPSEEDRVLFNGMDIEGRISRTNLNLFRELSRISDPVKIEHSSEVPTGCGLSTSGAGSISLQYALNDLFGTGYSELDLLQLAHIAEVKCRTGLGSVIGQSVPGIEVRRKIGAPGIGQVESYPANDKIAIIIKGPLSTSGTLSDPERMKFVTMAGLSTLNTLDDINASSMIQAGRNFTVKCKLITPDVQKIIDDLHHLGEDLASMSMIGETVICLYKDYKVLENYCDQKGLTLLDTQVTDKTAYLLKN